eukprot:gene1549-1888_t
MWLLGDGLTVGDLLLVLFWAAVNASWMAAILARSRPRLVARALSFGLAAPTLSMNAKMVARAFGSLLAPNLVLLFYPVSRGSVVLQALGISYPAAIRYHRWLGQAVMTFVLLHGGIYWCSFLYDKTWVYAALSQDTDINNLFGSISFIFGLVLWITASDVVRRKWYGVFKAMHHIGFWGFLVFGCCHNWALIWNFIPGLMLYAVDAVFRIHQAVFASCSTGSTIGGTGSTAGSTADCGNINLLACHPFTCVAVPWPADRTSSRPAGLSAASAGRASGGVCTALLVHIKAYDRWTRKLVQHVADNGCAIRLKLQGPYPELPGADSGTLAPKKMPPAGHQKHSLKQNGVVIVAGLKLRSHYSRRAAGELEFLAPRVLAMARTLGVDLTVRLFYTVLPLSNDSNTAALDKLPTTTNSVRNVHDDLSSSSLCPVLALGSFGATASFKLLLHFVVVIGTFCALILLRYFTIVAPPSEPWPTSYMGPVYIAVILAFTLLPGLVLLWVGLAAQRRICPADNMSHVLAPASPGAVAAPAQLASPASALTATIAAGTVGKLTLVPGSAGKLSAQRPLLQLQLPSIAISNASSNVKMSGGSQYDTLSVDCGRAATRELVRSWLAPLQQQPAEVKKMLQFDVFAMGPERLVADVQLLCDDINSIRSSKSDRGRGQAADLGSCHSVLMRFVRKTHQF